MERRYHLLTDIRLHKSCIKRVFEDNDRGPELDPVRDLIARRGHYYTLAELRLLSGFFWSAHDDCVNDNPGDYDSLEIYNSRRRINNGIAAVAILDAITQEENGNG